MTREVNAVNDNTAALRRDVDRHELSIADLWSKKASIRDIDQMAEDFKQLTEEVRSLRRTIIGFAFTVAVSAVGIAAAVLSAGAQ